jgi:uncharacterized small protein (DUF1192 family)
MAFDDETMPRNMPAKPKPLDDLSIDELHALIETHRAEIARAEQAIAAKERHRASVDSLFRKPG